jgi:N-acyl-D-amino-acid deacylase
MCAMLDRQMNEGAIGVSTGLEYVPGRFATQEELRALLHVAARHHAVHTTHIRNEGHSVIESAKEVLSLSSEAKIPLLISHLKITGRTNCRKAEPLLTLLTQYRSRSPLFVDQYPYAASSTTLEIYFPDWYLRESIRGRHRLLQTRRAQLKSDIRARLAQDGFTDFAFARVVRVASRPQWSGLTIRKIDRLQGHASSVDTQLDIVLDLQDRGGAQMVYHNICPDVVEQIQRRLAPMIGSDSAIRWRESNAAPHPRGWGAFVKFLGYSVRQRNVASMAEAIRRMTDQPARFFGLTRRGRIAPGYYADLVIFDAAAVAPGASYQHPFGPPIGIEHVLVNGVSVVGPGGRHSSAGTGASPGVCIIRDDRRRRGRDGLVLSTLPDDRRVIMPR